MYTSTFPTRLTIVMLLVYAMYFCNFCNPHYVTPITLSIGFNLSSVAEGLLDKIAIGYSDLGHHCMSTTKLMVLSKYGNKW